MWWICFLTELDFAKRAATVTDNQRLNRSCRLGFLVYMK